MRRMILYLLLVCVFEAAATFGQAPSASAWSPSNDIGVFVFGRNSQTADQQLKGESDCYGAARQQSGVDPKAPAAAGKTADQKAAEQKAAAKDADTPSGGRVKGAAIGAIAGDAGKGASAGAMEGSNEKSEDTSSYRAYCSCCRCFLEFFSRLPIGDGSEFEQQCRN